MEVHQGKREESVADTMEEGAVMRFCRNSNVECDYLVKSTMISLMHATMHWSSLRDL